MQITRWHKFAMASTALTLVTTVGLARTASAIVTTPPPPVIDFELPALTGGDISSDFSSYASYGITITNASGIVRDDPKTNWEIWGTNGRQFLGKNDSGTLEIAFSETHPGFAIDCSRSSASPTGLQLLVELLNGSSVVRSATVTLGNVDTWSTISFSGSYDYDKIHITPQNSGENFGCDNLRIGALPPTGTDVMPTIVLGCAFLGAGLLLVTRRRRLG